MLKAEYEGVRGFVAGDTVELVMPQSTAIALRDLLGETVGMYDVYSVLLELLPGKEYPRSQRYCVRAGNCRESAERNAAELPQYPGENMNTLYE